MADKNYLLVRVFFQECQYPIYINFINENIYKTKINQENYFFMSYFSLYLELSPEIVFFSFMFPQCYNGNT